MKLTTRRGQSNLRTVFIFVSCEQKGCYRVVSLGHLICDRRSYSGLSCRMQGGGSGGEFTMVMNADTWLLKGWYVNTKGILSVLWRYLGLQTIATNGTEKFPLALYSWYTCTLYHANSFCTYPCGAPRCHTCRRSFISLHLRTFHWNRTYTEIFVKLCLLIVGIIGT